VNVMHFCQNQSGNMPALCLPYKPKTQKGNTFRMSRNDLSTCTLKNRHDSRSRVRVEEKL